MVNFVACLRLLTTYVCRVRSAAAIVAAPGCPFIIGFLNFQLVAR